MTHPQAKVQGAKHLPSDVSVGILHTIKAHCTFHITCVCLPKTRTFKGFSKRMFSKHEVCFSDVN